MRPIPAGLTGTTLTIVGGQFDTVSPLEVTVCDTPCQVTGVTSTSVTCLAPAVSGERLRNQNNLRSEIVGSF